MFALISAISTAFNFLVWHLWQMWLAFGRIVLTKWGAFILICGLVWGILKDAEQMVVWLVQMLGNYVFDHFALGAPETLLYVLSLTNTFFPLSELCVFLVAYTGLVATMTVYRHVKSYVPGAVSGGT